MLSVLFILSATFVQADEIEFTASAGKHTVTGELEYPADKGGSISRTVYEVPRTYGLACRIGSDRRSFNVSGEYGDVESAGRTGSFSEVELYGRERIATMLYGRIGASLTRLKVVERPVAGADTEFATSIGGLFLAVGVDARGGPFWVFAEGKYLPLIYQRDEYASRHLGRFPNTEHKPADGYIGRAGAGLRLGKYVGVYADVSVRKYRTGEGGVLLNSEEIPKTTRFESASFGLTLGL